MFVYHLLLSLVVTLGLGEAGTSSGRRRWRQVGYIILFIYECVLRWCLVWDETMETNSLKPAVYIYADVSEVGASSARRELIQVGNIRWDNVRTRMNTGD